MKKAQDEPGSRRAFLNMAARVTAFGVMGGYVVDQTIKRKRLENDPNCIKLHTCLDCIEFGGCELDKADSARKAFPSEV